MADISPGSAITAARLQLFAPRCDYLVLAPRLSTAAVRRQIATPDRVCHWLAQLAHETGGLTRFEENLNYSAEGLHATWPSRFPTVEDAQAFARQPELIADKVYGGRMGNTAEGDGWRYRGRGGFQRTGKAGYAAATASALLRGAVGPTPGLPLDFVKKPDWLALPSYAFEDAADYWASKGLNGLADAGDIEAITRSINGGLNGLDDRRTWLRKAQAVWRTAA